MVPHSPRTQFSSVHYATRIQAATLLVHFLHYRTYVDQHRLSGMCKGPLGSSILGRLLDSILRNLIREGTSSVRDDGLAWFSLEELGRDGYGHGYERVHFSVHIGQQSLIADRMRIRSYGPLREVRNSISATVRVMTQDTGGGSRMQK